MFTDIFTGGILETIVKIGLDLISADKGESTTSIIRDELGNHHIFHTKGIGKPGYQVAEKLLIGGKSRLIKEKILIQTLKLQKVL